MMCVVVKPFTGDGEDFIPNQLVDGSRCRKEPVLITPRLLRQATQEEIDSAVEEGEDEPPAPVTRRGLKARRKRG